MTMYPAHLRDIGDYYRKALESGDSEWVERIVSSAADNPEAAALIKSIDEQQGVARDQPLMKRADQGHQGGHQ